MNKISITFHSKYAGNPHPIVKIKKLEDFEKTKKGFNHPDTYLCRVWNDEVKLPKDEMLFEGTPEKTEEYLNRKFIISFESIFQLVQDGWEYEEILNDVSVQRRETIDIALGWMEEQAEEFGDGVVDAAAIDLEAGRCLEWCNHYKLSLPIRQVQLK